MKILIFGRGVIASQYGWALEKAGNEVEFYVRPGRAKQYGPFINLEIIDARKKRTLVKEKWDITMREELEPNNDFDLILLSVNHNQLDAAINYLAPRVGKATVFIFNNLWADPQKTIEKLPKGQVVWGFPGAGGGFMTSNTLEGGFMKTIFMGFIGESTPTTRYKEVRSLFQKAGFSIAEKIDFYSWLLFHFAMNAGMGAVALKTGSHDAVFDYASNFKEVIILTRVILPVIKAKGGKISLGTALMIHLPAGLLGFVMQKAMKKGNLARDIMRAVTDEAHLNRQATAIFHRDVLKDAKSLGIELPRLKAMENLF